MQILSINKNIEDKIMSLRKYAEEHITPYDKWEDAAKLHGDPNVKDMPNRAVLYGGWSVIFSINACSDGTHERLLTVRHESQVPETIICNILLSYFGFDRIIPQPGLNVMSGPNAMIMFENFKK